MGYEVEILALVFMAFLLGGILKGAVGVGAPFIAVPIMAMIVDVPFAVAVFLFPNIFSNAWQTWRFRKHIPERRFSFTFALAGVVGAGIGTVVLAKVSSGVLITAVALVVLAYVTFRLANPRWSLSWEHAKRTVGPVGGIGGFFQGATGLSGPISVTYMNAVGLQRAPFIFTMSLYFLAMTGIQLPIQMAFGVMTADRMVLGLIAMVPLAMGMMLGDVIGDRISKAAFDRIILIILTLLALRLLWGQM